jgi:hypothetical protein
MKLSPRMCAAQVPLTATIHGIDPAAKYPLKLSSDLVFLSSDKCVALKKRGARSLQEGNVPVSDS